ncbi:hypothetical protein GCM10010103_66700 [Streptomyces paradoxus]|uniref:JmjC domain-containing protein n=1 Tax=Streptomyces paradoxus TaxID=66375 RepID=A0A7W9WLU6_9ACTN|nr:cupin-like domain-containing protein [Streptomyces paradoxus]MBB6081843.1 hypothetical protein [Streptomyces paradoxus]
MKSQSGTTLWQGGTTIDRRAAALPRPLVRDEHHAIGDLLPEFSEEALRKSYRGQGMELIPGMFRTRQSFPRAHRFDLTELLAWERRTKALMSAGQAFDVIHDPSFRTLKPYAVIPVQAFGQPLQSVIMEMHRRLSLDPYGFALLWIGSGGYVTPLHHDGEMVHGRWNLVVRGNKQFDFVPPSCRRVPRRPLWDLCRRFSSMYTSPVPEAWLSDGTGAIRANLGPGQMVTWGRRWWHRVEIDDSAVTITLSTRGHRPQDKLRPRALAQRLGVRLFGEVEHYLESLDSQPPVMTPGELRSLCR